MIVDYLVVGVGLTGAVIARTLHEHGRDVTVVDRRAHKEGNVHDQHHAPGIRTIEWKYRLEPAERDAIRGSVLAQELPFSPDDPNQYEYPFPSERNAQLALSNPYRGVLLNVA